MPYRALYPKAHVNFIEEVSSSDSSLRATNHKNLNRHPSISGTTNGVGSHSLLNVCEVFNCQLDITRRAVLDRAPGVTIMR